MTLLFVLIVGHLLSVFRLLQCILQLLLFSGQHRWAQLTQKLAPLTAIPLMENNSFANANPITQIFR